MTKIDWRTKKIKISDLIPNPRNPREISKEQVSSLRKSLERFDLAEIPAVNLNNKILAGHQRIKILIEMNRGDELIDVRIPSRLLSESEELAYTVGSNKIAGEFDDDKLALILNEIKLDFDLTDLGFTSDELLRDFKIGGEGLTDPDDVPEVPKKTNVKRGDVYQLGNHRLMCGDSTDEKDVAKLMGGEKADMVFTDPPYAVNYVADQDVLNMKSGGGFRQTVRPILGDNLTTEECAKKIWKPAFKNLYEFSKDDCSFYMTMCQGGDQMMMMMMMSEHWQIKHELIWVKSCPVFSMGRLDYDYQHEPILFGWKKKHIFYGGGQFLKSIWEIPKPSKSDLHPTMKPIELMENALLNSSARDQICLDLFGGSGSTLIACEKTGRKCRMMEIDPLYCQIIVDRWEVFSGKKAVKL